jgi:hypothetical protein
MYVYHAVGSCACFSDIKKGRKMGSHPFLGRRGYTGHETVKGEKATPFRARKEGKIKRHRIS